MTRCDRCDDGWFRFFKYHRFKNGYGTTLRKCDNCGKIKKTGDVV